MRSNKDLCLLCLKAEASVKGSHLVPAAFVQSMIGKRNYEDGHVIQPGDSRALRSFQGRANLNNTDPEIRQNEFVADFIFCGACEKRFGAFENAVIPQLNQKLKDAKQTANFPIIDRNNIFDTVQCVRINSPALSIFLYGVAWRMSILYLLKTGDSTFLSTERHESMRRELNAIMDFSPESTDNLTKFPAWPYLLLTCRAISNCTNNVVLSHPNYLDPYCFWMNEFLFVFSFDSGSLSLLKLISEVDGFINDGKGINQPNYPPIILDLTHSVWDKSTRQVLLQASGNLKGICSARLSRKLRISITEADEKIYSRALDIEKVKDLRFGLCYEQAFKELYFE
jgi:hypothetical protein